MVLLYLAKRGDFLCVKPNKTYSTRGPRKQAGFFYGKKTTTIQTGSNESR